MREVTRSVLIGRSAPAVYALINDIERYPQFVPGCAAARVDSRSDSQIVARLDVRKGPLVLGFTTRNELTPPTAVDMRLVDGPFDELTGGWRLAALGAEGCRATLSLRFALSNPVTALVLEPIFEKVLSDLVEAFVLRARQLPAGG